MYNKKMSFALKAFYSENHKERNLLGTSWRFESRRKLINSILNSWEHSNKIVNFLDIGSRDGSFINELNFPYKTTAIDIDPTALFKYKILFPKVIVKILDCNENFPFKNESYDLIFAGEIIEHLINPDQFLSEINRILKPGGLFIGSTPNAFRYDKRIKLLMGNDPKTFSDKTHTQYFSFNSLKNKLENYFSKVIICNHPTNLLNKYFYKLTSSGFIWQAQK